MFFRKKIKLVTHDGRFHADDVFATAVLQILLETYKVDVIRTRDEKIIAEADYVYDVGEVYDNETNRFDHHQEGGAGKRENGIPYSSFGLIWKKYGKELCDSEDVANYIERKVVQPIDAMDNGVSIHKNIKDGLNQYLFTDMISIFNPTWLDGESSRFFRQAVDLAKSVLEREILVARDVEKAKDILEDVYNRTKDKRIIVLNKNYPWESVLSRYPEPLFVVNPKTNTWSVGVVRDNMSSFENRKSFPRAWAGKVDEELAKITGVKDAVFCHNGRFIAVAKSKEGAIKLAKLALEG